MRGALRVAARADQGKRGAGGLDAALDGTAAGAGVDDLFQHSRFRGVEQSRRPRHLIPQLEHPLELSQPLRMRAGGAGDRSGLPGCSQRLRQITSTAFTAGLRIALLVGAGAALLAAIVVTLLRRGGSTQP